MRYFQKIKHYAQTFSEQGNRQFVKDAGVGKVVLVLLLRDFSLASRHQLLLFPLRKEHNNDNKQINNTCRGTDKL